MFFWGKKKKQDVPDVLDAADTPTIPTDPISPDFPAIPTESSKLFSKYDGGIEDYIRHEEITLKKKLADSERELRKQNATRAFVFSSVWAVFISFIIIGKAFCPCFYMNQTEYIASIGTLSITILTYYTVVIRNLFKDKE